jgi:MinD-like ATPase involved in chromosome partitioning or flagellar assembly
MNRAPDESSALEAWERFRSASQRFLARTPELVGEVPFDDAVTASIQDRRPVVLRAPGSPAARALEVVANWPAIETSRGLVPFYAKARQALR